VEGIIRWVTQLVQLISARRTGRHTGITAVTKDAESEGGKTRLMGKFQEAGGYCRKVIVIR
jgi:hypothetical protein